LLYPRRFVLNSEEGETMKLMWRSGSTQTILAAALVIGLPPAVRAETPLATLSQLQTAVPLPVDRAEAIARLNEARLTLDTLPAAAGASAGALADLRRDFESLQSMYLSAGGAAAPSGGGPAGAVGTTGTNSGRAVGSAGSTGSARAPDWRAQYSVVNSDIAALMAAPAGNAGVGTANAEVGSLRVSLQELRTRLERFSSLAGGPTLTPVSSAAAPSQTPSTVSAQPSEVTAPAKTNAEAAMLLQRMQLLLSHQESDDGRSLKLAGKVTMNRADVDEILAEIRDLTLMLQQ
jgi:hypothetical protein